MTHIITVAQQKGGCGKTTIAVNLAAWFAKSRRVALLDIDPQHSAARWFKLRQKHPGLAAISFSDVAGWRLAGELSRLRAGHDLIVIDSPPQVETDARLAVRAADLVLVPVQPSAPDVWAAEATFAVARAEKRNVRIVLNRVPATNTKITDQIRQLIADQGTAMLGSVITNRTGFAEAFLGGYGVHEVAPKSRAAEEMRAMAEETWALLPGDK